MKASGWAIIAHRERHPLLDCTLYSYFKELPTQSKGQIPFLRLHFFRADQVKQYYHDVHSQRLKIYSSLSTRSHVSHRLKAHVRDHNAHISIVASVHTRREITSGRAIRCYPKISKHMIFKLFVYIASGEAH